VIIRLQKKIIEDTVQPLLTWEGEEAMKKLWWAVEQSEGVLAARRARQAPDKSRFQGSADQKDDDVDDDDDYVNSDDSFDPAARKRSTAWFPDPISGCPSSLAETVMALLDSGFNPADPSAYIVREKLKEVTKSKIKLKCSKFNFDVPMSTIGFVIPGMRDSVTCEYRRQIPPLLLRSCRSP
jgi:hypothetical protein